MKGVELNAQVNQIFIDPVQNETWCVGPEKLTENSDWWMVPFVFECK